MTDLRLERVNTAKGRGRDPIPAVTFLGATQFGGLTFVEEVESRVYNKIDGRRFIRLGRFKCRCGAETVAELRNVKRGFTTSCGCILKAHMASAWRSAT